MFELKALVKESCSLQRISRGNAVYKAESGFVFNVPVSEMGDANFEAVEKGMTLMRWIKRGLAEMSQSELPLGSG